MAIEKEVKMIAEADELGQVLVRQADVNRVAVRAALPLEADQVPERGGHPGPDRRGELPEQPPLEELRASGHRLKQQGGDFHVAARRNLQLHAIQFEVIHGTVCDDLLVLGGD